RITVSSVNSEETRLVSAWTTHDSVIISSARSVCGSFITGGQPVDRLTGRPPDLSEVYESGCVKCERAEGDSTYRSASRAAGRNPDPPRSVRRRDVKGASRRATGRRTGRAFGGGSRLSLRGRSGPVRSEGGNRPSFRRAFQRHHSCKCVREGAAAPVRRAGRVRAAGRGRGSARPRGSVPARAGSPNPRPGSCAGARRRRISTKGGSTGSSRRAHRGTEA